MLNEINREVNRVPEGDGNLDKRVDAAIKFAKESGKIALLEFNGTPVVVAPGSDRDEVHLNWLTIRVLQNRVSALEDRSRK